jgi:hypothetical protein
MKKKSHSKESKMSFIYYVLILMLSYTGPVYAEIGVAPIQTIEQPQVYAQNNVEVGEISSGKIKIFVDRDHSTTAVVDKQDCDVLKKKDNTIALGWKFGGLMWGFGPEIQVGHSIGVKWKGDVQRMVAEYQELCSRFNTGRISQEEYNQEKDDIVQRGYNYAREIEKRFKKKKDDMFKEMDNGHYISLENGRFENGCCLFKREQKKAVDMVVQVPRHRRYRTDCRDVGVCNRSYNFNSVVPDRFRGTTFDQRTIIGNIEAAQRMNRGRYNRSGWNFDVFMKGGW